MKNSSRMEFVAALDDEEQDIIELIDALKKKAKQNGGITPDDGSDFYQGRASGLEHAAKMLKEWNENKK